MSRIFVTFLLKNVFCCFFFYGILLYQLDDHRFVELKMQWYPISTIILKFENEIRFLNRL